MNGMFLAIPQYFLLRIAFFGWSTEHSAEYPLENECAHRLNLHGLAGCITVFIGFEIEFLQDVPS